MGIENVDALKPGPDDQPVGQVEVVNESDTAKKTDEEMDADFSANDNLEEFAEKSEAHEVDENPLEHIGEEMPDPWSDPKQTDWPNCDDVTAPVEAPKEQT